MSKTWKKKMCLKAIKQHHLSLQLFVSCRFVDQNIVLLKKCQTYRLPIFYMINFTHEKTVIDNRILDTSIRNMACNNHSKLSALKVEGWFWILHSPDTIQNNRYTERYVTDTFFHQQCTFDQTRVRLAEKSNISS